MSGPPCQAFSRLRHIVEANGYKTAPNLIPEFERCVAAAQPAWFLMENVEDAPHPTVRGYQTWRELVRDVWVGGQTNRLRAFFFGMPGGTLRRLDLEMLALHVVEPARAVTCDMRQVPVAIGGSGKYKPNAKGGAWRGHLPRSGPKETIEVMANLQGVPPLFLEALRAHGAFTAKAIQTGIGNGVPLAMGRAVAKAVKRALSPDRSAA